MPANIIITQNAVSGGAGESRKDLVVGLPVTLTNSTAETTYEWTLEDVPIRSALTRGQMAATPAFAFTPDVKGTYRFSLRVNGSLSPTDNATNIGRVLNTGGPRTLGWAYLAADEQDQEDNTQYPGLGFGGDVNVRGWATPLDLQQEQTEESVWLTQNRVITSPGPGDDRLVALDPATGQLDPSVIPGGGGGSGSPAVSTPGQWAVGAGVNVGDFIYATGAFSGDFADNSALSTADPVGVVIDKPTPITATVVYMGAADAFVGLVTGTMYYLDTAGQITAVPPNTPGIYLTYVGVAANTTTLVVNMERAVAL